MTIFPFTEVTRLIKTLVSFTYADLTTILIPVSAISSVVAPISSIRNGFIAVLWIWLHLLYCNVSNQCNSVAEDRENRPWRPIPGGLISQANARILRWALVIPCLCFSTTFGLSTVAASTFMAITTILYDDFKFSGHWAAKNMCTLFAYVCFEVGAMIIMAGSSHNIDAIAIRALRSSSLIILSTIHVQDFPDVEGDIALNRKTIPIIAPVISRALTSIMITFWSVYIAIIWRIGNWCSGVLLSVGLIVAWRLYFLRTASEDKKSRAMYNGWLVMLHLLPANARWGTFSY